MPRPLTDGDRAVILQMHAAGVSRNDIARTLQRSGRTVSNVVQKAGKTFHRAEGVQIATEARRQDMRAKRAELEQLLVDDARRLREQIWQPLEYVDHGGRDFDEVRWVADEPNPADKLKLMQAAGAALDRSLKLGAHDSDDGVESARSMLATLHAALSNAFGGDPDGA